MLMVQEILLLRAIVQLLVLATRHMQHIAAPLVIAILHQVQTAVHSVIQTKLSGLAAMLLGMIILQQVLTVVPSVIRTSLMVAPVLPLVLKTKL